ncbi:hypothetical protein KGMB03357_20620 [Anaerotignum faecicola]|uniref:Uncharacterized protein n=1 Tax=Anaerotignum faecicola TaxID=2358141 RepID=A0A401LFV6_9FIRM|nr:hypothetical protein KGMB03357_20620 [Anaerotignum faecicola]
MRPYKTHPSPMSRVSPAATVTMPTGVMQALHQRQGLFPSKFLTDTGREIPPTPYWG